MSIKLLKGKNGKSKYLINELNLDKKDTLIFEYYEGSNLSIMCAYAYYYPLEDFSELITALSEVFSNRIASRYNNIVIYLNVKPNLVNYIIKLIENIDNNFYITVQTYGDLSLEEV